MKFLIAFALLAAAVAAEVEVQPVMIGKPVLPYVAPETPQEVKPIKLGEPALPYVAPESLPVDAVKVVNELPEKVQVVDAPLPAVEPIVVHAVKVVDIPELNVAQKEQTVVSPVKVVDVPDFSVKFVDSPPQKTVEPVKVVNMDPYLR